MPSTPPPRIQLDSNLKRWFARNLGLWKSRRVYFFADGETLLVEMMLRVQAFDSPLDGDAAYRFTWWPEKEFDFFERKPQYPRTGTMEAVLCGHQLQRSSGYLQESAAEQSSAASQIRQVDEHELIFTSHYGDWTILEHIRLVDQDRYRSRSIYSWRHGALEIAEDHHELHLEPAGELLQS
ncbi:hypothetical protein IQ216_12520 [Cyanobium sp. LEGE 06143]|uniref:hypothetical protein n=1 Tax=Cyanobium sp. LEGE 06143 TaxID=945727 RepID=UPI0018800732|nr:hypothetical protein [Cyanobium sp. LEGE 06143]MBE9173864.1 hypothetical protein [Cyanobium sp. LEGE 06143]